MTQLNAIEGTGEEISKYAHEHPSRRFLLVEVEVVTNSKAFNFEVWDEVMQHIAGYRGKFQVLPSEAYSTESLYE